MPTRKIAVLGSFVVDLMGRAPSLPAPGETVKGNTFKVGPGGKGSNQAIAARRAGADVTFITKVGRDAFGELALATFREEGLASTCVFRDDEQPTGAALILVAERSGQNAILVHAGACGALTGAELQRARPHIEAASVFLTQLETNLPPIEAAIGWARAAGARVVLNPAPATPFPDAWLAAIDVLTPNETEATTLTGIDVTDVASAKRAGRALLARGARAVLVTVGAQGAVLIERSGESFLPPFAVAAVDTTGAGDAFSGGLAAALAEGQTLPNAARFASATAALSVTRIGTAPAMPTRAEIDRLLREGGV